MKLPILMNFLDTVTDRTSQILENKHRQANSVEPRRFLGDELADVVGVPLSTIYSAEKAKRIPPRETAPGGRKLGYTLPQVIEMQSMWGTSPWRQEGDPPQVIAFTAFKGGCWKTNTTWYAGSYYANKGFRVCLFDLDPQASLTQNCGLRPDIDITASNSLTPYILREQGYPIEFVGQTIHKTYLDNMDIIPSSLSLASTEMVLAADLARSNGDPQVYRDTFFRVRQIVDVIKDDYDIILIDGTPSLGLLPLNIIFAADSIVVPTPTELIDFASTGVFNELLLEQLQFLSGDNAMNLQVIDSAPEIVYLPTRYSDSKTKNTMTSEDILEAIKFTYEDRALRTAIRKHESAVSNLGPLGRTVFDVNAGQGSVSHIRRPAILNARENFSQVFDEILERLVLPKWPSRQSIRAKRA
jgi:chromosome partitioning protein